MFFFFCFLLASSTWIFSRKKNIEPLIPNPSDANNPPTCKRRMLAPPKAGAEPDAVVVALAPVPFSDSGAMARVRRLGETALDGEMVRIRRSSWGLVVDPHDFPGFCMSKEV